MEPKGTLKTEKGRLHWIWILLALSICLLLPALALSETAIADFTKSIEANPNDAGAYRDRGRAYYNAGNYVEAIADYTKAIQLSPDTALYYENRAGTYEAMANHDAAAADLEKAQELRGNQ